MENFPDKNQRRSQKGCYIEGRKNMGENCGGPGGALGRNSQMERPGC